MRENDRETESAIERESGAKGEPSQSRKGEHKERASGTGIQGNSNNNNNKLKS